MSSEGSGRRPEFSYAEIEILKHEVQLRESVLFSNTSTDEVKEKEWKKVAEAINRIDDNKRTAEEVWEKWNEITSGEGGSGLDATIPKTQQKSKGKGKRVAIGFGVAAAVGAAAMVAAPLMIAAAGFGAGGVVAGSAAAAWQATIGNVAAGSLFASLQSAGAAGLAASTTAGIGTAGATAGGAGTFIGFKVKEWFNRKK